MRIKAEGASPKRVLKKPKIVPKSQPKTSIARISVENVCSWRGRGAGTQTGAAWVFCRAPSPAAPRAPPPRHGVGLALQGLSCGSPPGGSRASAVGFPVLRLTVLGSSGATCC